MPFHLYYRGRLTSNGDAREKQAIRDCIHPQLVKLWSLDPQQSYRNFLDPNPQPGDSNILYPLNGCNFACIVSERIKVHAELDILFLRPQPKGSLINSGGDIDNRLKTLFDGLRRPQNSSELPAGFFPPADSVFHCLLSDDSLITRVSVNTDHLLDAQTDREVLLIIQVHVRRTTTIIGNLGYIE